MRELSLAVVGAAYPNRRGPSRSFEIRVCAPGEPISLRLEPKNPADPLAVAVFSCREVQIGYLTAERAPWIGGMLRQGRELQSIFQHATRHGAVIRVNLEGELPILPKPPENELIGSIDFWPDDEPPDDPNW